MLDRLKQFRTFLGEVRSEVKKVTFPGRDEVVATTVVVLITSFVFAFFLFAADLLIVRGYELIIRVMS
jgi:preprotein translocase subunit SecE